MRQVRDAQPRAGASWGLDAIIARALAKQPSARFASVRRLTSDSQAQQLLLDRLQLVGLIGISRDITERHAKEQAHLRRTGSVERSPLSGT